MEIYFLGGLIVGVIVTSCIGLFTIANAINKLTNQTQLIRWEQERSHAFERKIYWKNQEAERNDNV